ncbi:NADase-type glycan-binding domain-containing protein [Streptomyces sp. NPDC004561]
MTTTQNCAECGTRAEPGQSFCDACGAVLSWTDRSAPRRGAERAAAEPASSGRTGDDPAGPSGANTAVRTDAGPPPAHAGPNPTAGPGTGRPPTASRDAGPAPVHAGTNAAGGPGTGRPAAGTGGTAGGGATSSGDGSSDWDAVGQGGGGAPAHAGTNPTAEPRTGRPAAGTGDGSPGWDAVGQGGGGRTARGPLGAQAQGSAPADGEARGQGSDGGDGGRSTETAEGGAGAPDAPAPTGDPASQVGTDGTAPTEPLPAVHGEPGPPPAPLSDTMNHRARQLLVPVTDPRQRAAESPSVAPVLPGRPAPQRPQVVHAPGEELGAGGGTPCPWCATPNRPDRHFCARCAMPMTREEQAAGVRRPWWRRMLDFRNRETPWAGERPRLRRTLDRVLSWLGAAIVLTLLVVLAFNIPTGVQAAEDHFAKRASVAPDSVAASRSYQGHPAKLAFDKWNNTWWGPGVSGSGEGQWIEAKFTQPTRLLDLIITPGVSTHADQLQKEALPHRLKATVTDDKGKTVTRELTLDQSVGGQRIPFRVGAVTSVRFTVESAYFPAANKQVAIAEIEFFGPSNTG